MIVSYRWLQELLDNALPSPAECAEALTLGGLEVEERRHVGAHLGPVRVARVLSSRAHPASKNPLTLVTIELSPGESLEVVCGAPNVPAAGGLVCFAPVGATLFDKKGAPFELVAKPIAGVVSTGMLCAEDELGLGEDHGGIIVLEEGTPGQSLLGLYPELEDHLLTLNVTPNRPDALGHRGVARELALLLGLPWKHESNPVEVGAPPVKVRLEDPARCPRYAVAVLENVRVRRSPLTARARLHSLGVRAINSVVDATNLVMLERGQPLHAFDRAQLSGDTLVVRRAAEGESLQTLDGQTRALHAEDLLITDGARPLALAGVMGGEGSGVTEKTVTVVLESAYFEPRGVRRSARRHGMHTEASHRFEREVDPAGPLESLRSLVVTMQRLAGGDVSGGLHLEQGRPVEVHTLVLRGVRVESLLGIAVADEDIERILRGVGCSVLRESGRTWRVTAPSFRPDLTREVDLIEEVGRVLGYHKLSGALAPSTGTRAGARRDFSLRRRVREALCALGLDETVHYGFLSAARVEAAGFDAQRTARVSNPLSEESAVLRPSLLPQLLSTAGHARRYGTPDARLFEVGSVFGPEAGPSEQGRPGESTRVAGLFMGSVRAWLAPSREVDFFDAKGVLEGLAQALGQRDWAFVQTNHPPAWAHPKACAEVQVGGHCAGFVAEVHPDVREREELPRALVAFELDLARLDRARVHPSAEVPGKLPSVHRDVALLVPQEVPLSTLLTTLRSGAGPLCREVRVFDRFVGPSLPEGTHSLAFALTLRAEERTLTDAEIDAAIGSAVQAATQKHGAQQR